MFEDQKKPIEELDKALLVEAAQTALNCLRKMYEAIENEYDAYDLYDDPSYWPLSLLKSSLGDEDSEETATQNWLNGEYIGPDENDNDEE